MGKPPATRWIPVATFGLALALAALSSTAGRALAFRAVQESTGLCSIGHGAVVLSVPAVGPLPVPIPGVPGGSRQAQYFGHGAHELDVDLANNPSAGAAGLAADCPISGDAGETLAPVVIVFQDYTTLIQDNPAAAASLALIQRLYAIQTTINGTVDNDFNNDVILAAGIPPGGFIDEDGVSTFNGPLPDFAIFAGNIRVTDIALMLRVAPAGAGVTLELDASAIELQCVVQ